MASWTIECGVRCVSVQFLNLMALGACLSSEISIFLYVLSPHVPTDFCRRPLSLLEIDTWKAASTRFFSVRCRSSPMTNFLVFWVGRLSDQALCKIMYIFIVSCSDRNMDNTELLKLKDPKYYNNPEQYDEFVRYVFSSYPISATVTSSRPFHHFRWQCQHCFFPASSPAQFKAHTSDCPGGKENMSVFCGHCGHTYITREQLHTHANRSGFHTQ